MLAEPGGEDIAAAAACPAVPWRAVSITARAASSGTARAVGQLRIRNASMPWSANRALERGGIALARRVADDVDRIAVAPGRRQAPGRAARSFPAPMRRAGRRPLRAHRWRARRRRRHWSGWQAGRRFCSRVSARVSAASNSSAMCLDAQHAGAAERGVVDRIAAGEHAGMRGAPPARRRSKCPAFSTSTGLPRGAARAADMNLRPWVMPST